MLVLCEFLTHGHFRPPEHHFQQMQPGAGTKPPYHLVRAVFLQLLLRLAALPFHLRIRSRGVDIFQFHDVAVRDVRITRLVRKHQKITVAVIQLYLRLHQIEGVQRQVGLEEALQVVLTADAVVDGGALLVT